MLFSSFSSFLCACTCVCVSACVCECMCVRARASVRVHVCVRTCERVCACVRARMSVYVCARARACARVYVCARARVVSTVSSYRSCIFTAFSVTFIFLCPLNVRPSYLTPSPYSYLQFPPDVCLTLGLSNPGLSVNPVASGCSVLSVQHPPLRTLFCCVSHTLSTPSSAGWTPGVLGQAPTGSTHFILSLAHLPTCSPRIEDGVHS